MTDLAAERRAPPPESVKERVGVIQWSSLPRRLLTIYTPLIAFIVVLLFPFYWMAITTFKSNEELYNFRDYNPFWVHSPTLENINRLLFHTDYPRWLMVTMTVAVVATAVSLFASVLAAYAIQRLRFKGGQYVGLAIYLAYLVPPSILFIPLYAQIRNLGLADSLAGLIVAYPSFTVPFVTWLLMGYFESIPEELEESAMIDGATRFGAFWRIVLPLAAPGLLAAALYAFTQAWNEFLYALVFITNVKLRTLPVGLSSFITGDVYGWGYLMAGAVLTTLPVIAAYIYLQKYMVEGLTAGSVKG
jgi:multiple sugar transport system permease protein